MGAASISTDARIYRSALRMLPRQFRADFCDEMQQDFEEARREALASPRPMPLWTFRARMLRDFARSFAVQWLRTGWPAIVVISMAATLACVSVLARAWREIVIALPSGSGDQDVIVLEMLTVIVFLFIAATILLTAWSGRIVRRAARRRR